VRCLTWIQAAGAHPTKHVDAAHSIADQDLAIIVIFTRARTAAIS
jgi:hypothetical protein